MRLTGEHMVSAAIVGDIVVVLAGGQKLGFRLRDRRLVCRQCGSLSEPSARFCYGCESQSLKDPLENSNAFSGNGTWPGGLTFEV
jgi:hypothetical protein